MSHKKMKILLIGAYGTFTNDLIQRFYKEKHTVYLICGENVKHKSRKVFEQYSFSYQNSSMRRIIESIKPDLVLYTGVFDPLFEWKNIEADSVQYIASLMNVLLACEQNQVERFVYLSNEMVYQENYTCLITEDETMTPKTFIGRTYAQAEELIKSYQSHGMMQVTTLRIAHLYGMVENRKECNDIVHKIALDILTKPTLTCRQHCTYQITYRKDAMEAIYKICMEPHLNYDCYHIANSESMNDEKIAMMILSMIQKDIYIEHLDQLTSDIQLDQSRFQNEFEFQYLIDSKEGIQKVVQHIMEHKEDFLTFDEMREYRYRTLWQKLSASAKVIWPYMENIVVLLFMYFVSYGVSSDVFFGKIDLFVLYVLLFAVVYGKGQGVFSAFLSVLAYFFHFSRLSGMFEVLISYDTYVWIAQLFIIAMSVGHLHDHMVMIKDDKDEEIQFLTHQLKDMQMIHNSNLKVKDVLENRIINYDDSLGKIYDITAQLDSMDPRDVIFRAAPMLSTFMETKDIAIYQIVNDEYARLLSATSKRAKSLGKSIRYCEMEWMQAFQKQAVYINKTLHPQLPSMASALYDDHHLDLIVMVWGLPMEKMTNYQANTLSVLSLMMSKALGQASRYMKAQEDQKYVEHSALMTMPAFKELTKMYDHAMSKGLCDIALFHVDSKEEDLITKAKQIAKLLRVSDFLGLDQQQRLCILLTNTSQDEAEVVKERLFQHDIIASPIKVGDEFA